MRQGAQFTLIIDPGRINTTLTGQNGLTPQVLIAPQKGGNLRLALLCLERADTIDQQTAGLEQLHGAIQHFGLDGGKRDDIARFFRPGHIWMPTDCTGRGAGCVQQHSIEGRGGETQSIAHTHFGLQAKPLQIGGHALEPLGRAINCDNLRPFGGQLRCLAAGGSTQIKDTLTWLHVQ